MREVRENVEKRFVRTALLAAVLLGAAGTSVLAQDVFLTPKTGGADSSPGSSSSTTSSPDSLLFPSSNAPSGQGQVPDSPLPPSASSGTGDTLPTLSANGGQAPSPVYPSMEDVKAIANLNRPMDPAQVRVVTNFQIPKTAADFAVMQGMTPAQFESQRAAFEKVAANDPLLQSRSPFAMVDLVTDGQRYQQALADRVKVSCNLPTVTVTLDMASFMDDTRTRTNINKKAIQPFGTALDTLCRDPRAREAVSRNFYGLMIRHVKGEQPTVTHDDGLFTLSADFMAPEPVSVSLIGAGMSKGLKEVAEARAQAERNAPQTPERPSLP